MINQTFSPRSGSSSILLLMDPILNQSRPQRLQESLSALTGKGTIIALAPSDHGVLRNGGRAGARWAPQALLTAWKKLAAPASDTRFSYHSVTHQQKEEQGFEAMLEQQAQTLRSLLGAGPLVHLGGGHDHILPLLQALDDRPVCVLNIDAHLDTRMDPEPHSGNPFRQFAVTAKFPLQLHQVGIHPYANALSTQTELSRGEMPILWRRQCDDPAHVAAFLQRLEMSLPHNARVVFSLDCDALMASDVEAVSAPNHDGLSLHFVRQLAFFYRDLCQRRGQAPIWGIYEYNPLYDTVSGRGARAIAGLMYDMVF